MISEEIKKMFRRIEIDKSNDSCGFEFADGFDCTFDNIATCYDDRLKLYDLVKKLQQENNQLKEDGIYLRKENLKFRNEKYELRSWLEEEINNIETLFGGETSMTIGYKTVLSKLNELEGGKNE